MIHALLRKAASDPETPWSSLHESSTNILGCALFGLMPIMLLVAHVQAAGLIMDVPLLLLAAEAGIRIVLAAILVLAALIFLISPAGHLLKRGDY